MSDDAEITGGDIMAAYEAAQVGDSPAPTDTTPAVSASADATVPPAETSITDPTATPTPQTQTIPDGEPPKDRWPAILENARTKAVQDALGGMDVAQAREILQGLAKHKSDPLGFFEEEVGSMPAETAMQALQRISAVVRQRYPNEVRSFVGRQLAQQRGQQEPQLETVPVEMPDGSTQQLVTRDSMLRREAWLSEKLKAEQQQALQPILSEREQRQKEAQAQQIRAEHQQWYQQTYGDLLTWAGMHDKSNQQALGRWLNEKIGNRPNVSPHETALWLAKGHREVIVPKLSAAGVAAVVTDQQAKASAGTINPASPTRAAQPPKDVKDMSWEEAVRHEWTKRQKRA